MRGALRVGLAVSAVVLSSCATGGREEFSARRATGDELVYHAQRYANTPAKLKNRDDARAELIARRGEGLRALMAWVHTENVMVSVLAQQMVEDLPADDVVPVLLECASAPNPRTRKIAAYFLGFETAPEHADKLMPLLDDDEAQGAAIRTLGKWKVRSAVPGILPFLSHEKEVRRIIAANALGDIGDPSAIPALIGALGDGAFTVREAAAKSLVRLGPAAEEPLAEVLATGRDPARRHAIRILGVTGSTSVIPALEALAGDADWAVRFDAAAALAGIRGRAAPAGP